MSHYTDIVIMLGDSDDEIDDSKRYTGNGNNSIGSPLIDTLNAWIVEQHSSPRGSLKPVPAISATYAGSINFLNVDLFMVHLARMPWEDREGMRVMLRDEGEGVFTIYVGTSHEPEEWEDKGIESDYTWTPYWREMT